jgi:hypothetical protein
MHRQQLLLDQESVVYDGRLGCRDGLLQGNLLTYLHAETGVAIDMGEGWK